MAAILARFDTLTTKERHNPNSPALRRLRKATVSTPSAPAWVFRASPSGAGASTRPSRKW